MAGRGGRTAFVARAFDRARWAKLADGLAVALAASLPWSTSATGILAVLWLIALVPTLDVAAVRRELATAAGGLPVAFWALGVLGMAWANVPLNEQLAGLGSFHKLLCIPLLMAQFRRSDHGHWVLTGFLVSCGLLLLVSFLLVLLPGLSWRGKYGAVGIPVKDYIAQSTLCVVCLLVVAELAINAWRKGSQRAALAWALLAVAFLANVLIVSFTRTIVVLLPIMLVLLALRHFGWKTAVGIVLCVFLLAAAAWPTSVLMQVRLGNFLTELRNYQSGNERSSASERLEFWKKSASFVAEAPVIGHGTGSIPELFRRSAAGQSGVSAVASANPHNQLLTVAIQLGLVGAALLCAMWISHLLLFRGPGLAAWAGLVVVVQNVVSSLFHSHLFDFTHGWLYVIGVGVAGGMVLRETISAGAGRVAMTPRAS
jgi:O-antigen ligase